MAEYQPQPYDPNNVPQQPVQQPAPQPQQPVYYDQQQQQPYQQPQGQTKSATVLIVLSVLEILFAGGLLAIIPLVFSIQANSAYKAGDIVTGDSKAKTAKIFLVVFLVIAILAYVYLFAMGGYEALYG